MIISVPKIGMLHVDILSETVYKFKNVAATYLEICGI